MNAEARLVEIFGADTDGVRELCDWVTYSALYLARLEDVAMPLSYGAWRELVGYSPGCFDWESEQALRAAFDAAQPGCCA